MATFTHVPSYGSTLAIVPKVSVIQFGDGYMQRMQDGINNIQRVYALRFDSDETELDEIDTFLVDQKGTINFDWTPTIPPTTAGKFICREWNYSYDQFNRYGINAKFEEVFES